jgi:hypothetical protein
LLQKSVSKFVCSIVKVLFFIKILPFSLNTADIIIEMEMQYIFESKNYFK